MRGVMLAGVLLLAGPAATPAAAEAARTAYFKVSVAAPQEVTWTMDVTGEACDGAIIATQGAGRSSIRVRTPSPQPAIAERAPAGGTTTLRFRSGRVDVPVVGVLTRSGTRSRSVVAPGGDGGCGDHSPQPPDCGTRPYPRDARLSVEYLPPDHWRFGDVAPLVPAIVVSGPESREWTGGAGFLNCPGTGIDTRLGVVGSRSSETGFGSLGSRRLFGNRKRFEVTGRTTRTVETAMPGPAITSGTWPVTTTIRWTVRFTRLSRRPRGL
jgi:hypothetical protein